MVLEESRTYRYQNRVRNSNMLQIGLYCRVSSFCADLQYSPNVNIPSGRELFSGAAHEIGSNIFEPPNLGEIEIISRDGACELTSAS